MPRLPNRSLRTIKIALLAAVLLPIALVFYELVIEPLPNRAERALIARITTHLKQPGDWAMVSDIHPGDWSQVCLYPSMSTEGTQTRERLRQRFQISDPHLRLPNGIVSSSGWNGVVMFFYPPNTVEAFALPNKSLYGFGTDFEEGKHYCVRERKDAVFVLDASELDPSFVGIRVSTRTHLLRNQADH